MAPRATIPFRHFVLLSPWALGVLRATSLMMVMLGAEMLHGAADMRAFAARLSRNAALRSPNATGTIVAAPHQSVTDAFEGMGRMTVVLGSLSVLNYIFYTGVPNIISVLDGGAALAATATFVWHTIQLWRDGMTEAPWFLGVTAANAALWAARRHPDHQVAVHGIGVVSLVLWMKHAADVAHFKFE